MLLYLIVCYPLIFAQLRLLFDRCCGVFFQFKTWFKTIRFGSEKSTKRIPEQLASVRCSILESSDEDDIKGKQEQVAVNDAVHIPVDIASGISDLNAVIPTAVRTWFERFDGCLVCGDHEPYVCNYCHMLPLTTPEHVVRQGFPSI